MKKLSIELLGLALSLLAFVDCGCPPFDRQCLKIEVVDQITQQVITLADVSVQPEIRNTGQSTIDSLNGLYQFPALCRGSFFLRISHRDYQLYEATHHAMPDRAYDCNTYTRVLRIEMVRR